jgi:outer membrane receptor protein involved in Fe transport
MRRSCPRSFFVSLALLLLLGTVVGDAQGALEQRGPQFLLASASPAKPPVVVDAGSVASLRRRVALSLDGARVGEALAEISRASGLQIVYADGVVPTEGRVYLRAEEITVAAALTEVLLDAGVDVLISPGGSVVLVKRGAVQTGSVAGRVTDAKTGQPIAAASVVLVGTRWHATTGDDGRYRLEDVTAGTYTLTASRIGYAKQSQSLMVVTGQEVTVDVALQVAATELEQVVVTGTVVPTERKAIPTPISVITADEIEQKGYQRVDQIFRGDIPGAVAWDPGPYYYNSYISIRGTSSLLGNFVKTYIDGVEVADPYYLATIDPSSIERIEVLRGPQGSTIYGSNASGGVMQIFTKKGEFGTSRPEVEGKASAGLIQSQWNNTAQQDHSLAVSGGGPDFSYRVGGGFLHYGDWLPEGGSTNASVYGGLRDRQGPVVAELSARYYDKSFGFPVNPNFQQYNYYSKPYHQSWILGQQTYGLALTYTAAPRWHHTLTVGYDHNAYDYHQTQPRLTTPSDTLLSLSNFDETKASLAYNTTVEVPLGRVVQSSLTAGADHWTYRQDGFSNRSSANTSGTITGATGVRYQYDNSGYFAQGQLGFWGALFVTAGVRAEDNQNFGTDFGLAWAPRVGMSYVRTFGDVSAKARVAYGKAIRPPDPGSAGSYSTTSYAQVGNPNLGPEQQVGWDGGLELYFSRRGSLEVTHYHQTAIDLIDQVTLGFSPVYTYQDQNVGKVRNTGWEFQGRLNGGQLSLSGTYSIVRSEVEKLSPTYSGDLLPGDQVLATPKHTAGATLGYRFPTTTVELGMTHIGSWVNYDYVAVFGVIYGGQPFRGSLRDYWITYPGLTKFNVALTQRVSERFSVFLRSDNVTNRAVSEQSNFFVNMGRLTMIGLRVKS